MTTLRRTDNFNLPIVEGEDVGLQITLQAPQVDGFGVVQRDPVTHAVLYQVLNTLGWNAQLQIKERIAGPVVASITQDSAGTDGFIIVGATGVLTVKLYALAVSRLKIGMPYDLFAGLTADFKRWLHGVVVRERV